jgi:hypothetical protein
MSETRHWFYLVKNERVGPIPESQFLELFQSGKLGPATMVWTKEIEEWTRAEYIEDLVPPEFIPPPLPREISAEHSDSSDSGKANHSGESVPQIRPWIRYWARCIDTYGFITVYTFALVFLLTPVPNIHPFFLLAPALFVFTFVEAVLFALTGTTPGKWLLGITVRTKDNERLSFSRALARSIYVWASGWGLGIPVLSLVTLTVSHFKLSKHGITPWDKIGEYIVVHRPIGLIRGSIAVLLAVILFPLSDVWFELLKAFQK